ncbi:Protoheme IX farnesyltransferase, mitochondrial [Geranomyces michiganensis]|nr:Protoheme IX farnesyltransferase, mitochondrial [Geranomyces michiganensis]
MRIPASNADSVAPTVIRSLVPAILAISLGSNAAAAFTARKGVSASQTVHDAFSNIGPSAPSPVSSSPSPDDAAAALRWRTAPAYDPAVYAELSKAKLSAFVVLTAMAGYAIAPGALSVSTLLWTTVGTGLCSGAANAINQWVEHPYDAQMARTRNRALVRHALSPLHAFSAGIVAGGAGVAMLAHFVNPLTAALGATNLILYTCVYTPMKRTSIANTWVGSVVGALPPMMGWAAATGGLDAGALLLGTMLYSWQFPHFNSLSWSLRPDYSKAGYRMASVTDPALNARVSLRHSVALFPMAWAAPLLGMTTPWFALDATLVNAYMCIKAYRFWKDPSDKTARTLFFGSLVHLPVLLALLMLHKNSDSDRLLEPNADGSERSAKGGSFMDETLQQIKRLIAF